MDKINKKFLKDLGFSENLIKIYSFLLKSGKVKASKILKQLNLQRSVVYKSLDELEDRGLVTKSSYKGIFLFSANDPESILKDIERKKKSAEILVEELKKVQEIKNREVLFYEGDDIITRVGDKSLEIENGSTAYFLGSSKFGIQTNLEKYWKKWHQKRINRGVHCKILYDRDVPQETVIDRNQITNCQAKYMPFGLDMPMWFSMFEDQVAIVVPGEEPPLAFIIKSAKTADALRKYFNYLWEQKTTHL